MVGGFAALPTLRRRFGVGDWRPRRGLRCSELLRIGVPSGLQLTAEVLAWSAFSMWVMAPFGTEAMGANVFVFRYMSLSFMPAFGVGVAVTALVGRYIGRGRTGPGRGPGEPGVRPHGRVHGGCAGRVPVRPSAGS